MPTNSSNSTDLFKSGTLNFAHRGYTANAPENTLAAIQAAIDLGVDGVEFDVRSCKSGEVVVFHDTGLERMTDGKGLIRDLTLAELKKIAIKHKENVTSEEIPTLEEVLNLVNGRIALNIEIKEDLLPPKHDVEQKVIDLVKKYKIENQTVISSFHPLTVRKLRKIDEAILGGFLFENRSVFGKFSFTFARFLQAKAMHMDSRMASTSYVKKVLDKGYSCIVWTVNTPELMKRLISDGVHVIITDKPELLKEIVKNNA